MSSRCIAAFDFDGTLTRRDTLVPFLLQACGRTAVARALTRMGPEAGRNRLGPQTDGPHHRDVTKAALLETLLAGRDASWFSEAGAAFASGLGTRLRPELIHQIRWHRDHGHELLIVSASLNTYLVPFAEAHGFNHVIAVEMDVDEEGRLTGQMIGPNVRGPEKATRLRAWLGEETAPHLWAYGNSNGDRELLAMAQVPVWVNRRQERRRLPREIPDAPGPSTP